MDKQSDKDINVTIKTDSTIELKKKYIIHHGDLGILVQKREDIDKPLLESSVDIWEFIASELTRREREIYDELEEQSMWVLYTAKDNERGVAVPMRVIIDRRNKLPPEVMCNAKHRP